MKNNKKFTLILIGMAIFIAFLGSVHIMMKHEREKLYDSLDAAREAYRNDIKKADIYVKKDGDYCKEISIVTTFEDNNLSNSWFHKNLDSVTVKMDDDIDELKLKERCLIMVNMKNEMQRNLNEYFANSEYNKIFKENSVVATMDYRGIYLEISHETKYRFQTSQYTYTFEYVNSMTVNDKETGETKYYDYFESDGVLERFEDRYGSKSSSKGSSQSNSSGNSEFKNNGSSSSGNKKSYDPYDVHDYKSAQDFADDKYEEFFDYEDDYDDEDEAYDAAEDYWNDNN